MKKIKNRIWNWIHEESELPKKNQLLIVLLVGILLLIIAVPVSPSSSGDKKEDTERGEEEKKVQLADGSSGGYSLEGYEAYLEKKVASSLEYVEGVGKVEVMITLKSSAQKVVEKDQTSDGRSTEEEDSAGGTRKETSRAAERTSIYTQSSDGSQVPYVSKELTPEIEGVVVIAQGGDNAVVIQNITEAVQALFGVEAHKIKIMKRTAT